MASCCSVIAAGGADIHIDGGDVIVVGVENGEKLANIVGEVTKTEAESKWHLPEISRAEVDNNINSKMNSILVSK